MYIFNRYWTLPHQFYRIFMIHLCGMYHFSFHISSRHKWVVRIFFNKIQMKILVAHRSRIGSHYKVIQNGNDKIVPQKQGQLQEEDRMKCLSSTSIDEKAYKYGEYNYTKVKSKCACNFHGRPFLSLSLSLSFVCVNIYSIDSLLPW